MTLDGIKDYLLINSLQYFIGADDIEVTDEVLKGLVERALVVYSNWRPLHSQTQLEITDYVTYVKTDSEGRRILNIVDLYFFEPILAGQDGKIDWDWDYNKDNGQLRIEITGTYIAETLVQMSLEDIDNSHPEFLEMVLALYMMYIGSSRKSFNFGDQPFENDGQEIYSDGKELWENTLEQLKTEQDNWYLSIL